MKRTLAQEWLLRLFVFVSCTIRLTFAGVYLKHFSASFLDTPAKFAVVINGSGICGALHMADPLDACSTLRNDFPYEKNRKTRLVLIVRGACAFEDKVRNAQDSGFHAAIVYDDLDRKNLISMTGNPEGISVHAVFVSKAAGEFLKMHARGKEGECCIVPSAEDAAWTVLLISFISFLVIISVLAALLIARYHRLYRQGTNQQSAGIDMKMVEVLPSFTFSSTCASSCHKGETCPICLEDYRDGEILRVLPCQHEFHASCVDSWLTKWGTSCPLCKHNMSSDVTFSKFLMGVISARDKETTAKAKAR